MKFCYLVLFLIFCSNITKAQTSPKLSTFVMSMKNFQKQEVEIRKALNGIRVQDLQVSSGWGNQIGQYKDTAISQLNLLAKSTTNPSIGDDLVEEMLLLEEAQELGGVMTELSDTLSNPSVTHDTTGGGKPNTWAAFITTANAHLSAFYTDAFHYIIWHARDVQRSNCGSKAD